MAHKDKYGRIIKDRTDRPLQNGDTIDLHQTVNGQNLFLIKNLETKDVRYHHDISRKYEYDVDSLLAPDQITGETEWEIIKNTFEVIYENEGSPADGRKFVVREESSYPHHYLISDGGSHVGGGTLLKKYCKKI